MLEFVKQYFGTILSALAIISIVYLIFWVVLGKKISNRKIQLSKRAGWPQIKGEIGATLISFIGSTAFMFVLFALKEDNLIKFYTDTGRFGLWYEVLTVFIMLIVGDTWFYWSHRLMHHQLIYKYVHALHHKSLDINPFTSTSFHVIEAMWLTLWIMPLAMIMPISMTALGVMQVVGNLNNLKSHLGYELFPNFFKFAPFNMLITATNHSLHHTQYNGNYGLFFRFWDIICDTELNTTESTFNEIHQRKDSVILDNTHYKTLRIIKLEKENPHTISVYFKPDDNEFYNYTAGQYLTLKVKVGSKVHYRCFSLSSSPNIDNFLRITVKLKGEVSHYFYNDAKIGDEIGSLLPVGDFIFMPKEGGKRHFVMVAGGSGITPLYSMINQILRYEPRSNVTLLYAFKKETDMIFKKELDAMMQINSQFSYKEFMSGKNRISKSDLRFTSNVSYFICGPDTFKEGISKHLNNLNIHKSDIHIEHFADGYVPWFGLF